MLKLLELLHEQLWRTSAVLLIWLLVSIGQGLVLLSFHFLLLRHLQLILSHGILRSILLHLHLHLLLSLELKLLLLLLLVLLLNLLRLLLSWHQVTLLREALLPLQLGNELRILHLLRLLLWLSIG